MVDLDVPGDTTMFEVDGAVTSLSSLISKTTFLSSSPS
jgi:hypothetical protein